MKNQNKGFVVSAILGAIALLIIGGLYVYENKKVESPASINNLSTETSPATTTNPVISLVSSATTPIGSSVTIKGTNLDPLGGYSGIGWMTSPHIFVKIKNKDTGQVTILWRGGAPASDGPHPISNKITFTLPQSICMINADGAGGCPADRYTKITPGQYSLSVSVDGRGTSNALSLAVTVPTN